MSYSLSRVNVGSVGINPGLVMLVSTDGLDVITTPGYLNNNPGSDAYIIGLSPNDIIDAIYSYNSNTNTGVIAANLTISISSGIITINSNKAANVYTSSSTPGTIRAFVGSITSTATTMTSGNLVGVRGVVNYVGSSTSAFIYGVQGKLIPTGTLASGQFQAGVFGQLDISAATINSGQIAPIWGDYGTSSGTLTSRTGMYGIAMTNTTAAVLAGNIYLYGGATNLMLLNDNNGAVGATYFQAAGTGASSCGHATYVPATNALQLSINGTNYWLPLFSSNS